MSLINTFKFCLCLLAVGFAAGNKVSEEDCVVYNLDMESKECAIVAYADGAEGQVAECCFRGLKLRQKYRNVKYNCLFC